MPEIRCAVSNCHYWGQENYCQANSILVMPDSTSYATEQNQMENSILDGMKLESASSTSAETSCQTFRPNV
ncbi:DUF1540 domain-containing protein [Ectobacillus polymachus]|uniref:DUF1540 domain-containing protein n=1 Tax=Ectobacillus polymachus TaxID=1508806 RepID=UPI003A87ABAB